MTNQDIDYDIIYRPKIWSISETVYAKRKVDEAGKLTFRKGNCQIIDSAYVYILDYK